MESIKIICSDIDGTILNSNRELSDFTIETVKQVILRNEIQFIFASSRMPASIHKLYEKIGINPPSISYNGALVLLKSSDISSFVFSKTIGSRNTKALFEKAEILDLHISLYTFNNWLSNRSDFWLEREITNTKTIPNSVEKSAILSGLENNTLNSHKIMCMGESYKIDKLQLYIEESLSGLQSYRSKDTYLEIAPKGTNKAIGLKKLEKHLKFSSENVLAFGDNINDIELLEYSKIGVSVSNASQITKSVSRIETDSNVLDGVAKYLQQFFNIR